MKNVILIIITLCLSFTLQSQDQYTSGMQKGFQLWGEGKATEAIAMFERISQAENEKWHPPYYAANVLIFSSFEMKDQALRMANLEKAKAHIKTAHDRSPDNSEITTLEGILYTGYVAMDPGTYGMTLSQKIMELHSKAVELDPNNPRALANSIEYEMGSARFFGKPMEPYCERLQEVIPIFDIQEQKDAFDPTFGKDRVLSVIENCGK